MHSLDTGTLNARIDYGAPVDALCNHFQVFPSLSKLIRITNDAVDCEERRKRWLSSIEFIFFSFVEIRVISCKNRFHCVTI